MQHYRRPAFNQLIGDWDVSSVNSAVNLPIGDWDVSNVTNITATMEG